MRTIVDSNSRVREDAADHLLGHCGSLTAGERVTIISDPGTRAVADIVIASARRLTSRVEAIEIPPLAIHGAEPPEAVAEAMRRSNLILGLTAYSMAHTQARITAGRSGARYLSLPDYSLELLADPAVRVDYRAHYATARRVTDIFTRGRQVTVRTAAGTDISLTIEGRTGNCCPGFVERAGDLGSPPDIESNISPIETEANGVVVIDGSIACPQIGLLDRPVVLTVANGRIMNFQGAPATVSTLRALFEAVGSPKAYVLAECGVGLNEKARLTGSMLTDEGCAGTMHFGFGSNATVGGVNDVPFHLDFVFRSPTLMVDGRPVLVDGALVARTS